MVSRGVLVAAMAALSVVAAVSTAPMDTDDVLMSNDIGGALDSPEDAVWDSVDLQALRKLLMLIESEESGGGGYYGPRSLRSWSPLRLRGPRLEERRAAKPWRTNKRQVRFRQCYFNPISCFRK